MNTITITTLIRNLKDNSCVEYVALLITSPWIEPNGENRFVVKHFRFFSMFPVYYPVIHNFQRKQQNLLRLEHSSEETVNGNYTKKKFKQFCRSCCSVYYIYLFISSTKRDRMHYSQELF